MPWFSKGHARPPSWDPTRQVEHLVRRASLIASLQKRAADPSLCSDQGLHPLRTPLDAAAIDRAEAKIGRDLPPLLRDVYRLVGNGGFGPGYGLLPLMLEDDPSNVETVVARYASFCESDPDDSSWSWPKNLLELCDWGCAIHSCVDLSTADAAVVTFDPNAKQMGGPMTNALAPTHASLEAWFADWIAGVKIWDLMFESDRSTTMINPFTKKTVTLVSTKLRRA